MEVRKMKTLSLSGVKMKLSGLVDLVNPTDEEIVITKNGCPAAVLPITENVSICFLYVESGCMISTDNFQSL